jgi:8-oxo-dGTP pyrophosphatase MutT (NUDIX family)
VNAGAGETAWAIFMNDRRAVLLEKLRAHVARGLGAHEAAMAADMIRFMEENPRCAERSLAVGHLTGSAWIVDATWERTLLTHHAKLGIWVQPGGHADGDLDITGVAMREAKEESGLTRLRLVTTEIFDVDRHWVPERKGEPGHWHYDVRFMIEADEAEALVITSESKDLRWVEIARMSDFSTEESMLRMARKTPHAKHEE